MPNIAAKTRRKKKANDYNSANNKLRIPPTETEDDTCVICEMPHPPSTDDAGNGENQAVLWINCDGCGLWYHMVCIDIPLNDVPSQWLCLNCREIW